MTDLCTLLWNESGMWHERRRLGEACCEALIYGVYHSLLTVLHLPHPDACGKVQSVYVNC